MALQQTLGSLPKEFIKKIPNYTFTKLFVNNFDAYVITNQTTLLPPMLITETKYINLIMNEKKYNIKLGSSTLISKTYNNKPYYYTNVYFFHKNHYVKEEMFYNHHKDCKYCDVWHYKMEFHKPDNTKLFHTEDYCGQMLLMNYKVDKQIKQFYNEFEKHLEKVKELK